MKLKKPCDCPRNRPIAVRKLSAPIAAPFVSVGRITDTIGRLRLRNGHGSGIIRLVLNCSPPSGGAFRFGKNNPLVGSVNGAMGSEEALPAMSDQVWKCMVSVGPMLIRIRKTSTSLALCASEGYKLLPPCSMVGMWNAAVLAIACR